MLKTSYKLILLSWLFIVIGMITFEYAGLLMAVLPFGFAAMFRGERDRYIKDEIRGNQKILSFVVIYYLGLSVVTFINIEFWSSLSGTQFVLLLFAPVLFIVIANDIKDCFLNEYNND